MAMNYKVLAQVIMPETPYSSATQPWQNHYNPVPPHVYYDDVGSIQATIITAAAVVAFSGLVLTYLYDLKAGGSHQVDAIEADKHYKRLKKGIIPVALKRGSTRKS